MTAPTRPVPVDVPRPDRGYGRRDRPSLPSIEDVADYLRVSSRWVYTQVRTGFRHADRSVVARGDRPYRLAVIRTAGVERCDRDAGRHMVVDHPAPLGRVQAGPVPEAVRSGHPLVDGAGDRLCDRTSHRPPEPDDAGVQPRRVQRRAQTGRLKRGAYPRMPVQAIQQRGLLDVDKRRRWRGDSRVTDLLGSEDAVGVIEPAAACALPTQPGQRSRLGMDPDHPQIGQFDVQ